MGNVVPIRFTATMLGVARCHACDHEWEAEAPVGTTDLECPSCGRMYGLFEGTAVPEGQKVWTCNCECDLFYVRVDGIQCRECGILTDYEDLTI